MGTKEDYGQFNHPKADSSPRLSIACDSASSSTPRNLNTALCQLLLDNASGPGAPGPARAPASTVAPPSTALPGSRAAFPALARKPTPSPLSHHPSTQAAIRLPREPHWPHWPSGRGPPRPVTGSLLPLSGDDPPSRARARCTTLPGGANGAPRVEWVPSGGRRGRRHRRTGPTCPGPLFCRCRRCHGTDWAARRAARLVRYGFRLGKPETRSSEIRASDQAQAGLGLTECQGTIDS